MSEYSNLFIRQGSFSSIMVVPKAIIILILFVFVVAGGLGTLLCTKNKVLGECGMRKVFFVELSEVILLYM